ncbi:hypothetical protein F4805DRAFT_475946 [Annulohypoxylon moriforme]|nr:hypothetical protein F4805DRAFT_475946 [Annulohypoxylon moriforme]
MAATSSSDPIIFYDIQPCPPIRAEPMEGPSLGADPVRFFADGEPFYTLPVIKDPATNEVVGDSFDIAVYLEKKYPDSPSLFKHLIGLYAAFNAHIDSIFPKGGILFSEGFPFDPVNEEQVKAEFCRRAGLQSWDQLTVRGEERRKVVEAYEGQLGEAAKYFKYSDGPFIGGAEPDYADFIIGGWLMMLSEIVAEWKEIRTWHGGVWGRLHDALEPYRGTW